jgi:hypothetical protein
MSPILFGTINAREQSSVWPFLHVGIFLLAFGTKAAAYPLQAHKSRKNCHFGSFFPGL